VKNVDYDWLGKAMALASAGGTEERLSAALGQLPTSAHEPVPVPSPQPERYSDEHLAKC
jgi:hypothetical protein